MTAPAGCDPTKGRPMADYTISISTDRPYEETLAPRARGAGQGGFGVLTEIDLRATLKAKLDVDVAPQVILGACRPQLAHEALAGRAVDRRAAALQRRGPSLGDGTTLVEAFDPTVMSSFAGDAERGPASRRRRAEPIVAPLDGGRGARPVEEEVLMDLEPTEIKAITTRMKRANGHLASVIRMMEEGSSCEDVLTQLAAVNKAIVAGRLRDRRHRPAALPRRRRRDRQRRREEDGEAVPGARLDRTTCPLGVVSPPAPCGRRPTRPARCVRAGCAASAPRRVPGVGRGGVDVGPGEVGVDDGDRGDAGGHGAGAGVDDVVAAVRAAGGGDGSVADGDDGQRRGVGSWGSSMPIRQSGRRGAGDRADQVASGAQAQVGVRQRAAAAGPPARRPSPSRRRWGRGARRGVRRTRRRTPAGPAPPAPGPRGPPAGSRRARARRGRAARRASRRGRC